MPTDNIVELLIEERDKLNRAIELLQGTSHGRGRAPASAATTTIEAAVASNGRRRGMSRAARKRQSTRMKAFWANRRKQAAKKAR